MKRPREPGPNPYTREGAHVPFLVDPEFSAPNVFDISADLASSLLLSNKLSREHLTSIDAASQGAEADRAHRLARNERNEEVCAWLNEAGIEYASMKNLRAPKAMMSDIDLLVADPSEQARATAVLAEHGFEFHRFRLLGHPRKVMAKRSDDDPRPVDIYPDAMWIRKIVCNADAVIERADSSGDHRPTPADDLYLVATHAYSHLSVSFAELYHGVTIVEEEDVDWETLIDTASRYGCLDGVAAYLLLVDEYLTLTGRPRIPSTVFDQIPNTWAVTLVRNWWQNSTPRSFPVRFPIWLPTFVSSAHHVPRVASELTPYETVKDFQSHYLAAASQLLLGEA